MHAMDGIVPSSLLAVSTVVGVVSQVTDAVSPEVGSVAQIGAVTCLCWLVLKTFPDMLRTASKDRELDRKERKEDRDAYRAELAAMREHFKCKDA